MAGNTFLLILLGREGGIVVMKEYEIITSKYIGKYAGDDYYI